jgi:DNA repair protein RadD
MTIHHPVATQIATSVNAVINQPQLRDYQQDSYDQIHAEWGNGHRNVLAVLPTGAGKTVLLSRIVFDHQGASCVIAHRQELVSQISIALARNGVRHRIIGPDSVIRNIVQLHMFELGVSFYDSNAKCAVAGVDTLVRRMGSGQDGDDYYYKDKQGEFWYYEPRKNGMWGSPISIKEIPSGETAKRVKPASIDSQLSKWAPGVTLWVNDEAHHVLKDNKWGKGVSLFPRAVGLGVTATPERSDGQGLGRKSDGVFDVMIVGPTMRELINRGYLTDYDIVVPPTSGLTLTDADISKSTGDYKRDAMVNAVEHSSLVGVEDDGKRKVIGDIVRCYEKFASGKLGVTFVPSIKIGERVKQQFLDEGIPAELVTADTPDLERSRILRRFKNREIMNLINVDLFGEGFDLPAIEVVSMARPTQSYGLYVQQFGRALRLLEGKTKALIIDHVGNVLGPRGHGLPDTPRAWSLDRRERRSSGESDDSIPLRRCSNIECFKAYERYLTVCPNCGTAIPEPIGRNDPEFVDGDLYMLDSATLAKLRGEVDDVDKPVNEIAQEYHDELQKKHCPKSHIMRNVRMRSDKHLLRQDAQVIMRDSFASWAGYRRAEGLSDNEIYRKFYLIFGVDYMTAMTYHEQEALDVAARLMVLTV